MNARLITRIAATAAVAAGTLTLGTAGASAGTIETTNSEGLPPGDVRNATAFVTQDGRLACAYDRRDSTTKCMNTTQGWKALASDDALLDVDGKKIADAPFMTTVTKKDGPSAPSVSTQGPTFDKATDQYWRDPKAVTTVRIGTNGYGDYVNQDFAIAKPGQVLHFPDGISFFVDSENHLRGQTLPGYSPWIITHEMAGQHD